MNTTTTVRKVSLGMFKDFFFTLLFFCCYCHICLLFSHSLFVKITFLKHTQQAILKARLVQREEEAKTLRAELAQARHDTREAQAHKVNIYYLSFQKLMS